MRVLHPKNTTYYMGDEERAELFLEFKPPERQAELDFYKKMLGFWIEFMEDSFKKRVVPEESKEETK